MKRARVRTEVSAAEAAADRVSSLSPALLSSQGDTCVQSCCINTFPLSTFRALSVLVFFRLSLTLARSLRDLIRRAV